jgi:NAD(P)-dependent dehydrogenase (short-subunit alcohol dehydrogenase family)
MAKRTALVTGGNRGIGFEVAHQLAKSGLDVTIATRDEHAGQRAAIELGTRFVRLDVGDPHSVQAALETLGPVDVLVNNAGLYSQAGVLEEHIDEFRLQFEVNALGPLALCQALVPAMRRRGYGRVVNVSSGYGQYGAMSGEGPAAYKLAKLALGGVTRMVAGTAGPEVKVNAADPGWVRTRMGGPGAPRSVQEGADTIVWLATLPDDGPTGGLFHDRKRVDW